jgi:hypothetical protein
MKKLFNVTCCGKTYLSIRSKDSIFVIAEDEKEAADKALNKMKELKYDLVDDFVSNVKLIADEKDTNEAILIL